MEQIKKEICPHPDSRLLINKDESVREVLKNLLNIDVSHMCCFKGICKHKHVLWTTKRKTDPGILGDLPDSYSYGYCLIKDQDIIKEEDIKKEDENKKI